MASAALGRKILSKNLEITPEELTNLPEKIVTLAVGFHHVLALDLKGKLWGWGDNTRGQVLMKIFF